MTTKLTKRDKILLYVMTIVLVAFAFVWLLILPQMNLSSELDLAVADAEALKLPMEAAVNGLDNMKVIVEESRGNLEKALSNFPQEMPNYEIDKMFTGLMTDQFGLHVVSLDMSTIPAGVMVPFYGNYVNSEGSAPEASATDEAQLAVLPLLTSQVTISASGTRKNLEKFVDELFLNHPSVRVTGYTFAGEEESILNLTCDFYMQGNLDAVLPTEEKTESSTAESSEAEGATA